MEEPASKPIHWIASSKKDMVSFGEDVTVPMGFALRVAQDGGTPGNAKPLDGFGGANVLEIVVNTGGDAYRGVYTVRFSMAIYVLHVFMKKSRKGSETPKQDIDLIKSRLDLAAKDYKAAYGDKPDGKK